MTATDQQHSWHKSSPPGGWLSGAAVLRCGGVRAVEAELACGAGGAGRRAVRAVEAVGPTLAGGRMEIRITFSQSLFLHRSEHKMKSKHNYDSFRLEMIHH